MTELEQSNLKIMLQMISKREDEIIAILKETIETMDKLSNKLLILEAEVARQQQYSEYWLHPKDEK